VAELAREIGERGVRRIALFGTRFVIESPLLDGMGVEVVRPPSTEVDRIHALYLEIIALRLCRRDHVETIVLAGTELALAFNETTAGFPAIDCTGLHVAGIMRRILAP
jgi:aspartate racemase